MSPAGGVPVAAGVMFVQVLNPVTGRMEWAVRLEQDDAARSYADIAASGYSDMLHDEERVGARQMLLGGAVPYGMRGAVMRYGAVRCGAVRCGAVRCGAMQCGALRCQIHTFRRCLPFSRHLTRAPAEYRVPAGYSPRRPRQRG